MGVTSGPHLADKVAPSETVADSYTALPGDREHETTELWRSKLGIARVADMVVNKL